MPDKPASAAFDVSGRQRASRRLLPAAIIVPVITWLARAAHAEAPQDYLITHGVRADSIAKLAWFTSAVSVLVILIVTGLLLAGVWRRRNIPSAGPLSVAAIARPAGGAAWIYWGVGITTIVLFVTMVWTFVTLAKTGPQPGPATVRLEVTGHQWWWEVRYLAADPSQEFTTANEIHIPVGEVVAIKLRTADVIHSFWVPKLAGKTDLIPGQENQTWIEAEQAGVYRGQCGEYCGEQHAHMAMKVIASPAGEFEKWRSHQLQPASSQTVVSASPMTAAQSGLGLFTTRCGICHTVRGTMAGGILGPDLTHIMSRETIAAATLPNNTGTLSAWIADPQHIKPGNLMPNPEISGPQLTAIRQYVQSLK